MFALPVEAQPRRRARAEVIAWSSNGMIVVLAEPQKRSRRRIDLVARRVPNGKILARVNVSPGQCAREIEGRVAISHACAFSDLRPRLPSRYRNQRFHIAANERGRISQITLRADGSIVEHELPRIGLVIRGRTVEERDDRTIAILEVTRLDRVGEGKVLDRRPVRPRARRRWTLLKAGENHFIVLGRGVLRRIGRRRRPAEGHAPPSRSDLARGRSSSG